MSMDQTEAAEPTEVLPDPPCSHCTAECCRRFRTVCLTDEEGKAGKYKDTFETEQGVRGSRFHMEILNNRCGYLQDDNRCGIYEDRPLACRNWTCLWGFGKYGGLDHSSFLISNPQVADLIIEHLPQFVEQEYRKTWNKHFPDRQLEICKHGKPLTPTDVRETTPSICCFECSTFKKTCRVCHGRGRVEKIDMSAKKGEVALSLVVCDFCEGVGHAEKEA